MQLSIIIVSYNVRALLAQCMASIKMAAKDLEYEIIVVDNNSKDDSQTYFTTNNTGITFIWNKENLGFAKANNVGLSLAKGSSILFLNPDTIVTQNCLEGCLDHLNVTQNCGAVGVQMIDGAGCFLPESKRNIPGLRSSFFYFSGLSKLATRSSFFNAYHAGNIRQDSRKEVPVLSGAFMMARTEVIKKAGGFDPRYFMYGEDVDLSITIGKLGLKNWYLGDLKILHYKGESSKEKNEKYYEIFFQAMKLFLKKHNGYWSGKMKSVFIEVTKNFYKLNFKLRKKSTTNNSIIKYAAVSVFCAESEQEKINAMNSENHFADQLSYLEEGNFTHNYNTAVIYSTTLYTYSFIIESITKAKSQYSIYIFDPETGTIIGSNGKLSTAVILYLD